VPGATDGEELNGDEKQRKRRHKVIIHSSPFLRCVQTSVAISAGLAQNPGHTYSRGSATDSPKLKAAHMHSSPKIRPEIATGSPALAPIPEPVSTLSKANGKPKGPHENIKKSIIRVDAFLGEWLTPDYFELITPPPSSLMMVAGAKADLLRREDYSNLSYTSRDVTSASSNVGFPGGWGSPVVLPKKDKDDGPLSSLSSLGEALPRRDRGASLSSVGSNGSHGSRRSARSPNPPLPVAAEHGIYHPPVSNYAIPSSDPIPSGFVAHARDACVDVDYQWDSMREPQNWGNGGEYGEEWSSMHKRFRKGLQQMVSWYSGSDDSGRLLTRTPTSPNHARTFNDETSDGEDTDLVIILVTHGAGCNALIGALTNQPVLLDVGMASLTMAVRKPTPPNSPHSTPGHSRASSRNILISDQYDVKLVANTEHLRSTSSTPSSSRAPSVTGLPAFRERFGIPGGSFDTSKAHLAPLSGNFGSIRRTASVATSAPRTYQPARQSSIGLWTAPQPRDEEPEEAEDDMILNFGDDSTRDAKPEAKDESVVVMEKENDQDKDNENEKDKDEEDDVAPLGLWGSPRPPGYAEKIREIGPKRRWTVNERG
jgi:hypothetical protein